MIDVLWRRKWPWLGVQTWNEIVFLHWPVSVEKLRPYVPEPLKIDEFDGSAWVSIVFFKAKNSRLRSFSPVLSYPPFYQLNTRTYVTFGKEPGVHFFSLDASSGIVVKAGQFFHLPFRHSEIVVGKQNNRSIFTSTRPNLSRINFHAHYIPKQTPMIAPKGSLSYWLTERYCIWYVNHTNIMKLPITHLPWVLRDVKVEVEMNGLLQKDFIETGDMVSHYAKSMTAYAHPPEKHGIYLPEI